MHETGLVKSLLHEVERVARTDSEWRMWNGECGIGPNPASFRIQVVRVRIGALCPFSEAHLREHFVHEAEGTVAEHSTLAIEHGTDPTDPLAQDVVLLSLDVEER